MLFAGWDTATGAAGAHTFAHPHGDIRVPYITAPGQRTGRAFIAITHGSPIAQHPPPLSPCPGHHSGLSSGLYSMWLAKGATPRLTRCALTWRCRWWRSSLRASSSLRGSEAGSGSGCCPPAPTSPCPGPPVFLPHAPVSRPDAGVTPGVLEALAVLGVGPAAAVCGVAAAVCAVFVRLGGGWEGPGSAAPSSSSSATAGCAAPAGSAANPATVCGCAVWEWTCVHMPWLHAVQLSGMTFVMRDCAVQRGHSRHHCHCGTTGQYSYDCSTAYTFTLHRTVEDPNCGPTR